MQNQYKYIDIYVNGRHYCQIKNGGGNMDPDEYAESNCPSIRNKNYYLMLSNQRV